MSASKTHVIPAELGGKALDAIVRALEEITWGKARSLIEKGKVRVDGEVITRSERRIRAGVELVVDPQARKPRDTSLDLDRERIVYLDAHVVVVDKPSGISTIPFGGGDGEGKDARRETGTLDERVRAHLSSLERDRSQRPQLGVVHRIDKETSGLVVFTRSWLAKQSLSNQFRFHTTHRVYYAIVHGTIESGTLRSHLVADRGDGLRGSIEKMKGRRPKVETGQLAVTHVTVKQRFEGATLIECRLETGRTHQIRIHLAEAGHALLGERVYIRDYGPAVRRLPAPRLMLHAAELGFVHPKTELEVHYTSPLPKDFENLLAGLRPLAPARPISGSRTTSRRE